MAEEEKKEGGEHAEAAAKPKSKKKLFIIIGVIVLLGAGGGVAAMLLGGGSAEKKGEHAEEEQEAKKEYATFELENFIVNLSEQSSFVKVKMLVEYDPALLGGGTGGEGGAAGGEAKGGHGAGGEGGEGGGGGMPPVLKAREPMIKDAVIRVLSSKTVKELLSLDGKEQLKEELIEAMNEAIGLDEGPIVAIYFQEFILQ